MCGNCPQLFSGISSGIDCSCSGPANSSCDNACTATEAAGYPFADAKWKNVSLLWLMSHSAGLDSGTVPIESLYKNNMAALRGLSTPDQWKAEQDLLA